MIVARTPVVLMYHSVIPYDRDPYLVTVRPTRLERQFLWLRDRGLRGVSVSELLSARDAGRARGLVGLTFDDGYADFAEYVVPALRRYGFTATVYVIAGLLGGANHWDPDGPRKQLMTADQVARVADDGIEIGSHGLNHLSLPGLPADALAAETVRSRRILRAISGQPVTGFCYPYGDLSPQAVASVRAAGYDHGCAIWRSELTGRLALPRTYVGDVDTGVRLRAKQVRHHLALRRRRLASRTQTQHAPTEGRPQ
ncbi:MAG TPA: polysaccharide deacetylase family protein [Pseudonocardiaceae bacterium]|jgi:peptidoglycan/xylan/chitin deacetylase (PgdA/CDA1 family)|nr:polysaccharide deacetylase family protein [Pseudonocardiaceae bacterium]